MSQMPLRAAPSYPIVKAHGAGNDFLLIDDRALIFPHTDEVQIRSLCHRRRGIGADGLILLQHSQIADVRMRYFNSDGCEAAMCGNGLRCLVRFLEHLGVAPSRLSVETVAGVYVCRVRRGGIETEFPPPIKHHWPCIMDIDQTRWPVYVLDTGVPHAVVIVDDIEQQGGDFSAWARKIRWHEKLAPLAPISHTPERKGEQGVMPGFENREAANMKLHIGNERFTKDGVKNCSNFPREYEKWGLGANVHMVQVVGRNRISIRSYERGVEGETEACGSGILAATYVVADLFKTSRWDVRSAGGDLFSADAVTHTLFGPAEIILTGIVTGLLTTAPLSPT